MNSMYIEINNAKAGQILQNLADLKLITIREDKEDDFLKIINKIRKKAEKNPPSLDEITKEVELVRAWRFNN